MKRRSLLALIGITSLLSMSVGYLGAQQSESSVESNVLAIADLGEHFECMEGKILRMTYYEIGPHFSGGEHNHRGRPEVFYVIDGTITEHHNGTSQSYGAGEGFLANSDLTKQHRIENATGSVTRAVNAVIVDR